MQSVLSPRCILMGSVRMPEQGRVTQGSDNDTPATVRKRPGGQLGGSMWAMVTMMLLMLAGLPGCVAFRAFDCNSQSSQIEQYSQLDPEPCGNMEKVHAIERELYGEIVQIKKERLVQVTRCTATLRLAEPCRSRAVREVPRPNHHRASRLQAGSQDGTPQAPREGAPVRDERQEGSVG
jgi:hypothetical protein